MLATVKQLEFPYIVGGSIIWQNPLWKKSLAISYKCHEQGLRTHETSEEQITKSEDSSEGVRLVRRH